MAKKQDKINAIIDHTINSIKSKRLGVGNKSLDMSNSSKDSLMALVGAEYGLTTNKHVSLTDIKDRDITTGTGSVGKNIEDLLKDGVATGYADHILSDYNATATRLKEYNFILNFIPTLKTAISDTVSDILSPDNISNHEIKVVVVKGDGTRITDDNMNRYMHRLKIPQLITDAIFKGFIEGSNYIYVTSRTEVLATAKANVTQYDKSQGIIESLGGRRDRVSLLDVLTDDIFSLDEPSDDNTPLIESAVSSVISAPDVDNDVHIVIDPATKTKTKVKGNKSKVKLDGVFITQLDSSRVFPIEVNGAILGYYYLDITKINTMEANDRSSIIRSLLGNSTNTSKEEYMTLRKDVIDKLTYKLKYNITSRFARNNSDLMDSIMNILHETSILNTKVSLKYIPVSNMFTISPTTNNVSILDDIMMPARQYILRLLKDMLNFLFEDSDKYMIKLKTSRGTPLHSRAMNAINQFTKTVNSPAKLLDLRSSFSIMTRHNKLIIPVNNDGDPLFDVSTLEGSSDFDYSENREKMKDLEGQMLSIIGRPMNMMEQRNDVDFASRISATNEAQALKIMSYQRRLRFQLDDLLTNIFAIELNDRDVVAKVILDPPKSVEAKEKLDKFTNIQDYVNKLIEMIIPDDDDKLIAYMKNQLTRRELPNEDWDAIDSMIKTYEVDKKMNKLKGNGDDDDM